LRHATSRDRLDHSGSAGYRRNFVNCDDKTANPTEEEFNQNGTICTNEAVRQNQWRNGNGDSSRTRNRADTDCERVRRGGVEGETAGGPGHRGRISIQSVGGNARVPRQSK
jgi:hypothetical protein